MTVAGDLVAGRFRLESPLGEGAMGVVWRAIQTPLDRPVALKLLRPAFGNDPKSRLRFEREARVASALDHPSAVAIHELGEDAGRLYIAMELLEGRTLRAELSTFAPNGLPLARALDVTFQIADLLVAAHNVPLVHRDLKPENVFAEADGRIRVVDFGLAFITDPTRDHAGRMTVEGVVAGTPAYLSPEQARGGEIGPATDIYALGCLLFELLTGDVPFGGTEMEVITRQMFAPPPVLRDRRSDLEIPVAVESMLRRMLAKKPEDRPTAADVCATLLDLDPALARGRGKDDSALQGRAARMVKSATSVPPASRDAAEPEVAVVGQTPADLLVALAAAGVRTFTVSDTEPAAGAAAIWAPGATPADVTRLAAAGAPVITDMDPRDVPRLAALVRAGVSEVAVRPVTSDELARKLRRAIRIHQRRSTP